MKFKVTVRSRETLETATWTLGAGSLEQALAMARAKAAQVFPDKHELDLEPTTGNAKELLARTTVVMAAVVALLGSLWLNYQTNKDRIRHEILLQRQEALFDALRVVDHVYASVDFAGYPRLKRSEWDIQKARDAMNKMLIYCVKPETTVKAFMGAIGLHNPDLESTPVFSPANLDAFRREVARELGLPAPHYDARRSWIYSLPGTIEDSLLKLTTHAPLR